MTKEEIDALKKLRDKYKFRIQATKDKPAHRNRNIKRVIDLYDITEKLKSEGRKVNIEADYYTYEYWGITEDVVNDVKKHPEKYISSSNVKKPINKQITQPKISIAPPKKSKYIISLAWTEDNTHNLKNTIDVIKEYFDDLDLKNVGTEQFDKGNVTEYVSKYEWVGDDESFKILKYSSQFILDTVSKSDYEKFNIAIYGKKKES